MTADTDQPTLAVTQADREAANALDDALGFLTDLERPIVLQAFARHRTNSEPRPAGDLREALEPFERTTLLTGREDEDRPLLMPMYPRHIRGIQQYLGVQPAHSQPGTARLVCPKCGSVNVLVARDMKSTRRCGACNHSWLPAQDTTHSPAPMADGEAPDEDWLTDVIDDSLDMDWTGRVGAKAIIAAWEKRHD